MDRNQQEQQSLRVNDSHDLLIGQVVRVTDEDVLNTVKGIVGNPLLNPSYVLGVIEEIDGQDINISICVGDPDRNGFELGGWNVDFSVIW